MKPVPDCGEESYRGSGKFNGRKALVTGGDSGIGRAAVIALLRDGADVAINYVPAEEPDAQDLAERARKDGTKLVLLPGDITDQDFCKELVTNASSELGGLDILVNNAAYQLFDKVPLGCRSTTCRSARETSPVCADSVSIEASNPVCGGSHDDHGSGVTRSFNLFAHHTPARLAYHLLQVVSFGAK